MNLVRVLPLLVAAPVVLSVTPAIGDPIASAGFFIVASVPATQTVIYCRSLPTGIGDLKVISGPASSDARAASDAARASRPAGPAGFSLAGALAEPARGALDVSFSLADAAPARPRRASCPGSGPGGLIPAAHEQWPRPDAPGDPRAVAAARTRLALRG
jgi:hypothetical protein